MGQMCISGSRGPPAVGSVQPRAASALSWDSATWRPESHMPSCLADKDALNPGNKATGMRGLIRQTRREPKRVAAQRSGKPRLSWELPGILESK